MWDFVSFNTFTLYCSSYTYLGKKQHKKIWKTIVWKKCVTLSAPNVEVANTYEWVSFSSYLAIDFQWKKLQFRLAYMLLSLCEKMGWKWHWVGKKCCIDALSYDFWGRFFLHLRGGVYATFYIFTLHSIYLCFIIFLWKPFHFLCKYPLFILLARIFWIISKLLCMAWIHSVTQQF